MLVRLRSRPSIAGCLVTFTLFALIVAGACAPTGRPAAAPPTPAAAATAVRTAPPSARAVFPLGDWERVENPEALGYSKARLNAVAARLQQLPTTAMIVVVNGRAIFEYGDLTALSYIASVRKSCLAMLLGNYVANGKVRLTKTLAELQITDIGGITAEEQEATIADLLAARSGVYHPASNAGDNLADAPPRGSQKHGTYYLYSNWDFNALGTIFERETGRDIYDAFESDLARPTGMQDFRREEQRKSGDLTRSVHPAYHIVISTRDMARLGYLMLREGRWNGQQLVPRDWVKRITTPVTRLNEMNPARMREGRFGYAYLWWVFDGPRAIGPYEGAYSGIGAGGQYITVLPKLDMVVAHKTILRPQAKSMSHDQFWAVLDELVAPPTPAPVR
jgi:CubicO group peptidase (beta-lactamase class C family)